MPNSTVLAPTFSGFIVSSAPWPVQYWYNVGVEALVVILTFLFLEETGFTRPGGPTYPTQPRAFLPNRMATFFFTTRVVPKQSFGETVSAWRYDFHSHMLTRSVSQLALAWSQVTIAISPVTIFCGAFLLVSFGWAVAVTTMLAVFLQTPVALGGYGFTARQNAACEGPKFAPNNTSSC